MVAEPRRSSFVTWLLIGLVVALGLGTAGAVAIPIFRCPTCRLVVLTSGELPVRRVRVEGKWRNTDAACGCCANRMRVTGLTYAIHRIRADSRR